MRLKVQGFELEITNYDKVLFPESGYTKADLVTYYEKIADIMLPHLIGRPISMYRFPNGINKDAFFQKEAPKYFPDWINRVLIKKREGGEQYQITCENKATLVYLANQVCTIHTWLSRSGNLRNPDKMIFDLDPPGDNFDVIRDTAFLIRDVLKDLKISSFVMTTGSRGLHVAVPVDSNSDFKVVRAFARGISEYLARKMPDVLTTEINKEKRKGRVFLDYLRNSYAATSVAPYSVRAVEGAPVATPLEWNELKKEINSQSYNISNIFQRIEKKGDSWQSFFDKTHSLEKIRDNLSSS